MQKEKREWLLHWNMSMAGGFLGGYAILVRGGILGSAQTGNMIEIVIQLLHGNWIQLLLRTVGWLIYVLSLTAALLIPKYVKKDFRKCCILLELAGIVLLGLLPKDLPNLIGIYPIFALTALQWGTFCGTKEYNSATIFSTNNLRQTALSCAEYIRTKNPDQKRKFNFYSMTLLSYHIGVAISVGAVYIWHIHGAWACAVLLLSAYFIHNKDVEQVEKI